MSIFKSWLKREFAIFVPNEVAEYLKAHPYKCAGEFLFALAFFALIFIFINGLA